MNNPLVSVVIPTRSIGYFLIFENLPALAEQTYTHFEVLVLPNEHDITEVNLVRKYPWLRVIPTKGITRPAEKRDLGVAQAKGDIIAFIDDDAYPSPRWLEHAVHIFQTSRNTDNEDDRFNKIAAVCGPGVLPKSAGYEERVFDATLKTRFGSGGYAYRFTPKTARFVDDFPSMNFLIKKDIFQKVGGFNSDYWPGEDSKLCEDIVYQENHSIYYDPSVLVYHHRRNELTGYLKQHANYGYHRGAFFAHGDTNSRRPMYLVPTFFVIYLLLLPFMLWLSKGVKVPGLQPILMTPIAIYAVTELLLFLKTLVKEKSILVALGAVETVFLTHLVYGILFMKGFFTGLTKKENIYGRSS